MYRLRDINAIALCYCHFYCRGFIGRTMKGTLGAEEGDNG